MDTNEFNGEYISKLPADFKIPFKDASNAEIAKAECGSNNMTESPDVFTSPLQLLEAQQSFNGNGTLAAANVQNETSDKPEARKRKTDPTEQTSVKNTDKSKASPIIYGRDASYPDALNQQIQPLICNLCNTSFNSVKISISHYESKNHIKKVTAWLTDWAAKTGEPLPKIAKTIKDGAAGPNAYHCKACDLPLTSLVHANQHFNGKKHKMVVANISNPAGSGYYDSSGKWIRTPTKVKTDSRYGIGESFRKTTIENNSTTDKEAKSEALKHCNICNIDVSSESQMQDHLSGSKHAKKLKQLDKPSYVPCKDTVFLSLNYPSNDDVSMYRTPTGNYYCKTCDFSLQDPSQMKQHLGSKRHATNLKSSADKVVKSRIV